jgi:amino acid adenylation domain-containing protein
VAWVELATIGGGKGLDVALGELDRAGPVPHARSAHPKADDLAYILYTSGSTGKPKGVMLSQLNATSFVDWCTGVLRPSANDRFSSHAPFHFDLSILDLYVPIKHGASIVLVPDNLTREPQGLADFIERMKISVWYSAPSILSLLAQFGKLEEHNYSRLRAVLFAGEVFPIVHLRSLTKQLPLPRYLNLYGPTETNVCTYYELDGPVPDDRNDPYPIGPACAHLLGRVIDADGQIVAPGGEGELCIAGDHVMQGYWSLDEQTAKAFIVDADGTRWYKTGDIVVEDAGAVYRYVSRRDRMVKKRGYRIELGEIESALYRHPHVREAAVIALRDDIEGVKIKAHLTLAPGERGSMIQMKKFCSEQLPLYMVPDLFIFHPALPKTSTDKIDYQTLIAAG